VVRALDELDHHIEDSDDLSSLNFDFFMQRSLDDRNSTSNWLEISRMLQSDTTLRRSKARFALQVPRSEIIAPC
jgi:hypothetical protein